MARYQCNVCGGIYISPQPDGLRYFHRCPPRAAVRVRRPNGTEAIVDPADVAIVDTVLEQTFLERPDARDENVVAVAEGESQPKHDGAGRTELRG
jgi:hypothetical protein